MDKEELIEYKHRMTIVGAGEWTNPTITLSEEKRVFCEALMPRGAVWP